jgi:large subunit ribosomal protein L32
VGGTSRPEILISGLWSGNEVTMPNPKRRHSKARTRQRRAHDALKTPQFYIDKDSGEAKVPHRIDAKTGTYRGRQIIDAKEAE